MHKSIRLAFVLVTALVLSCPATALVINVPMDQPTIQAGIVAASPGDTVLVADGAYLENIDFLGKAITVTSVNGPDSTTIDGGGIGWVAVFENGEGRDSVLERFTITNGTGGIQCLGSYPSLNASPTLQNNVITGNTNSSSGGGGVRLVLSKALVKQNDIINNSALTGGGIYADGSYSEITGNRINDNTEGGISISSGRALIVNNQISGNIKSIGSGGGIYVGYAPDTEIRDNVITDNTAGHSGGGIYAEGHEPIRICSNQISGNSSERGAGMMIRDRSPAEISNNLISYNTAEVRGGGVMTANSDDILLQSNTISHNQAVSNHGGGIYITNSYVTVVNSILFFNSAYYTSDSIRVDGWWLDISHSDVEGGQSTVTGSASTTINWGSGMIDVDPLFVDGPHGQACLSAIASGQASNSPGIDAGSDWSSDAGYDTSLGRLTMNQMTTRTDQIADTWIVDLGWHNQGWPANSVGAWVFSNPQSGTLPFTTQFTTGLINRYLAQSRRMAVKIDVNLANGANYTNWRAGWTNLDRGVTYSTGWPQYFPALGTLVGVNQFSLTATDVTPAPFNQPPYPPAGDTATGSCTVTGLAP